MISTASVVKSLPYRSGARHDYTAVLTGLFITSVIPALFWTAVFAGSANLAGIEPGTTLLAAMAFAIATLLGTVYCALCIKPA